MKCVVTGSAGFFGHDLCLKLLDEGFEVLGIDNFNPYYDIELKKDRLSNLLNHSNNNNFKFLEFDLNNRKLLEDSISAFHPNVICHLAAQAGVRHSLQFPLSYIENNIKATINILEVARENGIKDIVFASTSSVYGSSDVLPFVEEDNTNKPLSIYAASKLSCELLCHTYNSLYGIRFRIMRFFTVYGPWGRPDMSPYIFANNIVNKRPINVYNKGEMMRDFTYIDDIVSGFYKAINKKLNFEIINLGCGSPINLESYINEFEVSLNIKCEKRYLDLQPGEMIDTWADISKAKKLLGYIPEIKIKEGVNNYIEWFKDYYNYS